MLAFGLAVLAGVALVDAAVRGSAGGSSRLTAALVALAVLGASYLLGIRPAVTELPEVVVVRNPLRTWTIPWTSVIEVDRVDVVRVHVDGRSVRCYALPRRGRAPGRRFATLMQGVPGVLPSRNPLDVEKSAGDVAETQDVVERLRTLTASLGTTSVGTTAPVVGHWAPDSLLALASVVVGSVAALTLVLA